MASRDSRTPDLFCWAALGIVVSRLTYVLPRTLSLMFDHIGMAGHGTDVMSLTCCSLVFTSGKSERG
jgi:hypothetical protein